MIQFNNTSKVSNVSNVSKVNKYIYANFILSLSITIYIVTMIHFYYNFRIDKYKQVLIIYSFASVFKYIVFLCLQGINKLVHSNEYTNEYTNEYISENVIKYILFTSEIIISLLLSPLSAFYCGEKLLLSKWFVITFVFMNCFTSVANFHLWYYIINSSNSDKENSKKESINYLSIV